MLCVKCLKQFYQDSATKRLRIKLDPDPQPTVHMVKRHTLTNCRRRGQDYFLIVYYIVEAEKDKK